MRLSTTIGPYQTEAVIQGCEAHADAAMIHLTAPRKRSGYMTSYTVTRGTESFEIDTTFAIVTSQYMYSEETYI